MDYHNYYRIYSKNEFVNTSGNCKNINLITSVDTENMFETFEIAVSEFTAHVKNNIWLLGNGY